MYRYLLTTILSLGLCLNIHAQEFSYVYIQGDKQVPFYVKIDDEMMPRYGKNYCIISQLAAGPITIQILFQQNTSAAQKFTIEVPQNGYRGFMLLKKNNVYTLYDIQRQYYIRANNKIEEDKPTNSDPSVSYVPTNSNVVTDKKTTTAPIKKYQAQSTNTTRPKPVPSNPRNPRFMENVELNNQHTVQQPVTKPSDDETIKPSDEAEVADRPQTTRNNGTVINSDCPKAMNNDAFETIQNRANEKSEETRLKYLLTKLSGCYSTAQVRLLTKTLTNDPERYTYLKRVYPRVTDQAAFPALENLLSTEEWKGFFRLIVP